MIRPPGVLLDANSYRRLSFDEPRFQTLLEAERRRSVARWVEPFSAQELLAHLANPQGNGFNICRRAILRVYQRCGPESGGPSGIIRDSESRIVELVTGSGLAGHDAHTDQLGILISRIATTPLEQPLSEEENVRLRAIAEHIPDVENNFASTMHALRANIEVILASEKGEQRKETLRRARRLHGADDQRARVGEALIRNAYQTAGSDCPEPLPPQLIERVLRHAAAAIEFEIQLWRKVVYDGANPDRSHIRNLRWDQRIAFNIGQSIGGRDLWLVTGDRAFAAVAEATGYRDRVHTLESYEEWLARAT